MKKQILTTIASGLFAISLLISVPQGGIFAQEAQKPGKGPQGAVQPLTAEQKTQIQTILSHFNAKKLTEQDVGVIQMKLREAGIRLGPEVAKVMKDAGFDPEQMKKMAPGKRSQKEHKQRTMEERMAMVHERVTKPLNLDTAQARKVDRIFREFFVETDKIAQAQKDPKAPLDKKLVEPLEKKRDDKVSQLLTKEQNAQFQELRKNAAPKLEMKK